MNILQRIQNDVVVNFNDVIKILHWVLIIESTQPATILTFEWTWTLQVIKSKKTVQFYFNCSLKDAWLEKNKFKYYMYHYFAIWKKVRGMEWTIYIYCAVIINQNSTARNFSIMIKLVLMVHSMSLKMFLDKATRQRSELLDHPS